MMYLLSLIAASVAGAFAWNSDIAYRSVYHCAATYCDRDTYEGRTYIGPTSGFKATYTIYNAVDDTNGYIGYNDQTKEIVVAFRGSQSARNWITNIEFFKEPYPACSGCEVHIGFYDAEQNVINGVKSEVSRLRSLKPTYTILITGHSLGAAYATLTGLDIQSYLGVTPLVYTFGSPRIGNDEFATWSGSKLVNVRMVHNKDTCPHMPFESQGFHHVSQEIWQETDYLYKTCDTSGEDPNCSDSISYMASTWDDHYYYMTEAISDCATAGGAPSVRLRDGDVKWNITDGGFSGDASGK